MIDEDFHSCRRCGVCCEKGGPGLHQADHALVDEGHIPGRCLFTLRRGELARDNVMGTLAPLTAEIIKIKGRRPEWTCLFYNRKDRSCGIYGHRPLECRVLNCRDTRQIEAIYGIDRLTRRDLLAGVHGLWDLVENHEWRCSYTRLAKLVGQGARGGRLIRSEAILEMLRFDAHIRQLTVDKGRMDQGMLDFIFGRPLADTIHMFDIRLTKNNGNYVVTPGPTSARTAPYPSG